MSIAIPPSKAAIVRWAKAQDASLTPGQIARRYGFSVTFVKKSLAWQDNVVTSGRRA